MKEWNLKVISCYLFEIIQFCTRIFSISPLNGMNLCSLFELTFISGKVKEPRSHFETVKSFITTMTLCYGHTAN